MLQIALASQSPRRRELLGQAGYDFRVFPLKVSEIIDENLTPQEVVSHLATVKLAAALEQHKELNQQGFLILTADTLVVFEGRLFGKPKNISQAELYLGLLSGTAHSVITGFALRESGTTKVAQAFAETRVNFRELSKPEIAEYVRGGEPMDKAGAYAIQGEGRKFVSSFSGSWSNVVGLPLESLERVINDNGWRVSRRTT